MGPYTRASHVLTGKCKTRANLDRLVSTKTFSNATFRLSPWTNFEKFFHAAATIPFKLDEPTVAHQSFDGLREINRPRRASFTSPFVKNSFLSSAAMHLKEEKEFWGGFWGGYWRKCCHGILKATFARFF